MAEPRDTVPKKAGDLYALLARFDSPDALVAAVDKARKRGFTRLDAFSPFPVEGLAEALDFKSRAIAPLTFAGGLLGGLGGFGMQVATNLDFPLDIGGRPLLAPQAFALITFELMVLGAVCTGIVSMLALNRLPRLHHPLFEAPSFHLASSDSFLLALRADDPVFERAKARRFLGGLHPVSIEDVALTESPG